MGKLARYVLNDKHYDVTFIPINQELEDNGSTVLPKQVVYDIVERAANRVILPVCLCRIGCRCEDYPTEICCIAMRNMQRWSPKVKERMHALDWLSIEVTEECNGCQKCVKAFFAQAIVMKDERAVITEGCKGCGICASTCQRYAISITVTDGDRMLSEAFRRIESSSDVT